VRGSSLSARTLHGQITAQQQHDPDPIDTTNMEVRIRTRVFSVEHVSHVTSSSGSIVGDGLPTFKISVFLEASWLENQSGRTLRPASEASSASRLVMQHIETGEQQAWWTPDIQFTNLVTVPSASSDWQETYRLYERDESGRPFAKGSHAVVCYRLSGTGTFTADVLREDDGFWLSILDVEARNTRKTAVSLLSNPNSAYKTELLFSTLSLSVNRKFDESDQTWELSPKSSHKMDKSLTKQKRVSKLREGDSHHLSLTLKLQKHQAANAKHTLEYLNTTYTHRFLGDSVPSLGLSPTEGLVKPKDVRIRLILRDLKEDSETKERTAKFVMEVSWTDFALKQVHVLDQSSEHSLNADGHCTMPPLVCQSLRDKTDDAATYWTPRLSFPGIRDQIKHRFKIFNDNRYGAVYDDNSPGVCVYTGMKQP
jgi:hypothetical protein